MTLADYLLFFQTVITAIPFTITDVFFVASLLIFVASEKQLGVFRSILVLVLVLIVWGAGVVLYSPISAVIQNAGLFSKGAADGTAVLLVVVAIGAVAVVAYRLLTLNSDQELLDKKIPIFDAIFNAMTFLIIVSTVVTLLLSFPLTVFIKNVINESVTLSYLSSVSQAADSIQQKMFRREDVSTLNFLTVSNISESQPISRGMRYGVNPDLSSQALKEINRIRTKNGVRPVEERKTLSEVAQVLSLRMVTINTLSRSEIDGRTPFDLLAETNAVYSNAYFMTAQAQSIEIALQGLQQIPQYEQQILDEDYTSVGVSVVSLNEYGYIVSLLFTQ